MQILRGKTPQKRIKVPRKKRRFQYNKGEHKSWRTLKEKPEAPQEKPFKIKNRILPI